MTGWWRLFLGARTANTLVSVSIQPPPTPQPPPLLPAPPAAPHPPRGRWIAVVALIGALVGVTIAGSFALSRFVAAHVGVQGALERRPLAPPVLPTLPPRTPAARETPPSDTALAALSAVLNATPATPGVTIDQTLAHQIVVSLWPVREEALVTADFTTIGQFETGVALEGDPSEWAAPPCGCPDPLPRPIASINLFVPRQTAYPSSFLAEVTTASVDGSLPDLSFMVLTRSSAHAHWMLALETGYSFAGSAWVYATPPVAAGGFDRATPNVGVKFSALPADLAAYYQHWEDSGTPPKRTPFGPGVFTSQVGQQDVANVKSFAGKGAVHHVIFSADPAQDGDWAFASNDVKEQPPDGWVLSCGTVRYVATTTINAAAAPLIQPSDLSTWGPTLPAGQYTKITQWGLHESCVLADADGVPFLVLGRNGGVTRSAGVATAVTTSG